MTQREKIDHDRTRTCNLPTTIAGALSIGLHGHMREHLVYPENKKTISTKTEISVFPICQP